MSNQTEESKINGDSETKNTEKSTISQNKNDKKAEKAIKPYIKTAANKQKSGKTKRE